MFDSTKQSMKVFLQAIFLAVISLTLISCGGSSSSSGSNTTTTSTLSGTAAVGIPIDGDIIVTDSLGATATATIDVSGNYSVDVTGMTAPFIIAAVPDDPPGGDTQYSFASQANITVNVTPLTTLTLYNANGQQDLSQLLANWTSLFSSITQQDIDDAMAIINTNLASQLSAAGLDPVSFDLFSSVFNTDGNGFDGLLDSLVITLNPGSGFTIDIDGTPFAFDPNIVIGGGVNTGITGSLALTGNDTDAVGTSFEPTVQTGDADAIIALVWGDLNTQLAIGGSGGQLSLVTFNTSLIINNQVMTYSYALNCGFQTDDCSNLELDTTNKQAVFNNLQMPLSGFTLNSATGPLTLDGTLNWQ